MNRRRKIIVLVLVLVVVLALCAILVPSGPPEPIFDGKPLSYWLTQRKQFQPPAGMQIWVVGSEPALDYKRLDTNSIPFLVHAFESSDGPARRNYAVLWSKLPAWLQSCLPRPRDTMMFRSNALLYLMNLHTFDSPLVLPAMARTLEHDPDQGFRGGAANFLGQGNSKDPAVIHALVHGSKDKDYNVRWYSTNALRKLDPAALTNAVNKL